MTGKVCSAVVGIQLLAVVCALQGCRKKNQAVSLPPPPGPDAQSPTTLPVLPAVLREGKQKSREGSEFTVRHVPAGYLALASGEIVACDGGIVAPKPGFTVHVGPGRYPVILGMAASANDQRVAYAMLQFAEGEVTSWEMAVEPGQDPNKLKPDELFGYPVDSGTGCFMDANTVPLMAAKLDQSFDFFMVVMKELERNGNSANIVLDANTSANMILFYSGWGDGCYASYFGRGREGKVLCIVTDFEVIDLRRVWAK